MRKLKTNKTDLQKYIVKTNFTQKTKLRYQNQSLIILLWCKYV